jgi:hypothetical protein
MTLEIIKVVLLALGFAIALASFLIALNTYQKAQKFKRIQNLSNIWQRFLNTDTFLDLFVLMEKRSINTDAAPMLQAFDEKIKFKFLGMLEEVALYANSFEVDREQAVYLFQWHFHYLFNSKDTREDFWHNIGGVSEMNSISWKQSHTFASFCKPE